MDYMDTNPKFAFGVAVTPLYWLADGWGYEITGADVFSAYNYALKAAEVLGVVGQVKTDIKKIVINDSSPGMFVKDILSYHLSLIET